MFHLHKNIIERHEATPEELERARGLVLKYGQNSISYLTLENDKTLFFSEKIEGVIPFGVVGDVIIVCGDPVCAPEDFKTFLQEFNDFCENNLYYSVFLGTTAAFVKEYEAMGYKHVKAGDEARFDLDEYKISGGKMQKLRANVNHANKAGLVLHEYKPNECRDVDIEKGIDAVSKAWLGDKKSGELGFGVGGVNLKNPLDRRYFYLTDEAGTIVAFNVFLPFMCPSGKGYLADVTRRLHDAPGGATEKINFDAFMIFHGEGTKWGSLGLSPLANVHEDGVKDDLAVKLLEFIYEHGNSFYGFKDLHHAKDKYKPTDWVPSYIVYSTKHLTAEVVYAIIKIQNPGGISDFLTSKIKDHFPHKHH